MKATKKILEALLNEYIQDGDHPMENQMDPRFSDCFDSSIIDEFFTWIKRKDFSGEEEIRRAFRNAVRLSESHANMFKRGRVINKDVAYAMQVITSAPSK